VAQGAPGRVKDGERLRRLAQSPMRRYGMGPVAGVIFDWGRTLYDPDVGAPFPDAPLVLASLAATYRLAIVSLVSGDDYTARGAQRHAVLEEYDLARHFAAILFGTVN